MKKSRTKRFTRKAEIASKRPGAETKSGSAGPDMARQLSLPEVLVNVTGSLWDLVVESGMQVLSKLLEDDRTRLCGAKNKPQPDRRAYRHGQCPGEVVLGGRKVTISRPRVRSVEGTELELPTWSRIADADPLQRRVVEQMVLGVSTRNYPRSLEPLEEPLDSHGISKSSVSRHFVTRTAGQVEQFLSRPLDELDLPVVMVDGKNFGDHVILIALGIDRQGRKHVLGVVEGTTESEQVCRSLLRGLVGRGLVVERARLFVLDGSKGLRSAVRSVFGQWALVQRCQVHKSKNVVEHLPESKRVWVRAAIRKAYQSSSKDKARRRLLELAAQLTNEHPNAAASLREGLDETLTVIELGLSGWLAKTLRSTNPIESVNDTLQRVARNVKRWRGGMMALRWCVSGCIEAERSFRRIKGYHNMPELLTALEAKIQSVDSCAQIA